MSVRRARFEVGDRVRCAHVVAGRFWHGTILDTNADREGQFSVSAYEMEFDEGLYSDGHRRAWLLEQWLEPEVGVEALASCLAQLS